MMQQMLRQMTSSLANNTNNYNTSDMIQNVIYFFNQPHVRDHVLKVHTTILPAGKKVLWDGTYFFNEQGEMDHYHHEDLVMGMPLSDYLKTRRTYQDKACHYVLATCCITYEKNKVHFLSLIYDRKKQVLIFFDPGIHLYEKGQDRAVPIVREAFRRNGWIHNIERVGLCSKDYYGKKWGIQYDGSNPVVTTLPADSFCQSWTLYYLVEFLRNKCSDRFFSFWCSIPPPKRETFMLMNFFLPHLQNDPFLYKEWKQFYPQGDVSHLNQYTIKIFSN